jgi:hypothetical protein
VDGEPQGAACKQIQTHGPAQEILAFASGRGGL